MSEDAHQELSAAVPNEETAGPILFSVTRRGTEEPIGPYEIEEILEMLRKDELSRQDYVYYEGMEDWAPIDDVFEIQEQISHFVDDGQDRMKVAQAFTDVSEILANGEEIYYIAVQERSGLLSKSKDSIVLTSRRLFMLHDKRGGFELESFVWSDISNTLMKDEGKGLATFSILLHLEKRIDVPHIPVPQVQRIFKLSQELRDLEIDE